VQVSCEIFGGENMKDFRIYIMVFVIACLAPLTVAGEDFYVEESLTPIVPSAIQAIKKYESRSGNIFRCVLHGKFVDLAGAGNPADLVVTTKNACQWAASAGPVWVLRNEGDKFTVVLKFVTYNLEIMKEKSNGLRNIKTSRGTAGSAEVEFWAYSGRMYKKTASYYFSSDDEVKCKAHPDICPFEF